MRRPLGAALLLLALVPGLRAGTELRLGAWYGPQFVNEAKINDVYGASQAFCVLPYVEARFGAGWTLGAAYEAGYNRSGVIGPYQYTTSLTLSGFCLLGGYEYKRNRLAVFAQAGLGLYAYAQTVDNPNVTDMPVDAHHVGAVAAAGIKFYAADGVFIGAEARYVALKVQPYDATVDLGGWRLAIGAGIAFEIR